MGKTELTTPFFYNVLIRDVEIVRRHDMSDLCLCSMASRPVFYFALTGSKASRRGYPQWQSLLVEQWSLRNWILYIFFHILLIFLVCQGISAIGFTEAARTWQGKAFGTRESWQHRTIFLSCFLNWDGVAIGYPVLDSIWMCWWYSNLNLVTMFGGASSIHRLHTHCNACMVWTSVGWHFSGRFLAEITPPEDHSSKVIAWQRAGLLRMACGMEVYFLNTQYFNIFCSLR